MFLVTVRGSAERTLRTALEDLAGGWRSDEGCRTLSAQVVDQSGLIALLCGLHELGIRIERVERLGPPG